MVGITTFLDPAKMPGRAQDQAAFDNQMGLFMQLLPKFGGEVNALAGNLNSIAAGGAYALPYIWKSVGSAGGMNIGGGSTSQQNAIAFDINNIAASGIDVSPLLAQFDQSSSTVKGYIRLIKANDSSSFLVFAVTGRTPVTSSGYQYVTGFAVQASAVNPFANGDSVLMYFQRTGDAGTPGILQQVVVRDQRGSNVASQSLTANTWNRRVLNTLVGNQVTGFQLGAYAPNTFTLTAGKYWIDVTAPARNPSNQQIRLFNVTANATYDIGGSDFANSNSTSFPSNSRAMLRTYLEITATTVYAIEHFVTISFDGGVPSNAGIGEIYTELRIVRVG